jgi:hypothetical protein
VRDRPPGSGTTTGASRSPVCDAPSRYGRKMRVQFHASGFRVALARRSLKFDDCEKVA